MNMYCFEAKVSLEIISHNADVTVTLTNSRI